MVQPLVEVGEHLGVGRPLTSEQTAWRVLVIERDQETIIHVKVFRLHVRSVQSHSLTQHLPESARILELFDIVPIEEAELALFHRLLHHVFEGFQEETTLRHVSRQLAELDDLVLIGLAHCLLLGGLFGHAESTVDAREEAGFQSLLLDLILHTAITVNISLRHGLVVKKIIVRRAHNHVRRRLDLLAALGQVNIKLMLIVCLNDRMMMKQVFPDITEHIVHFCLVSTQLQGFLSLLSA